MHALRQLMIQELQLAIIKRSGAYSGRWSTLSRETFRMSISPKFLR
jgi:hypothetical protein